jgi:hypothetical protein
MAKAYNMCYMTRGKAYDKFSQSHFFSCKLLRILTICDIYKFNGIYSMHLLAYVGKFVTRKFACCFVWV